MAGAEQWWLDKDEKDRQRHSQTFPLKTRISSGLNEHKGNEGKEKQG